MLALGLHLQVLETKRMQAVHPFTQPQNSFSTVLAKAMYQLLGRVQAILAGPVSEGGEWA